MDELVIGEKRYVSSKKAAEITGYAKDYVGQLCREGYVEAKMVGRSWYVLETSIREHRFGAHDARRAKDASKVEEDSTDTAQSVEKNSSESDFEGREGFEAVANAARGEDNALQSPVLGWQRPVYRSEEPTAIPPIEPRTDKPTAVQGHSGAFSGSLSQAKEGALKEDEALSDMQSAWKEWFDQKRAVNGEEGLEEPQKLPSGNAEIESSDDVYEETYKNISKEVDKYSDVGNTKAGDGLGRTVPHEDYEEQDEDDDRFEVPIQRQKTAPVDEYVDDEDSGEETQAQKAVQIPLRRMRPQEEGIIHEERIVSPPKGGKGEKGRSVPSNSRGTKSKRSSVVSRSIMIAVALVVIAVALVGSGKVPVVSNPIVDYLGGTSTIKK